MPPLDVIKAVGLSVLFLAIFVVLPVLYLFMDHQRKMFRLMRGDQVDESDEAIKLLFGGEAKPAKKALDDPALLHRIQALESEVALLKAQQAEQESQLRQRLG